jgi:hypothetical protein
MGSNPDTLRVFPRMRAGLAAQNLKIPIPTDASPKLSLPAAFSKTIKEVYDYHFIEPTKSEPLRLP